MTLQMNDSHLVSLAEKIATQAHDGQFRRDGLVPYIEHPRSVVERVPNDPDAQVVAWLHDVLEDTSVTAEELETQGIPKNLVDAVELITKRKGKPYEDYLEDIAASPLATKVKIADMLANLSDKPTDRQIRKYAKGLLRLTEPA